MSQPAGIRRGFIYLLDVDPVPGSGASKRRPVLIIQNDQGNAFGATTIVIALSSRVPSRIYPFHVALPEEVLGRPGVIMCEQIRTVEMERLDREPLAECPPDIMAQVERAISLSLGLSPQSSSR